METPLHVLIIEDSPADAELITLRLAEEGLPLEWQRVQTEPDFLAALKTNPDIILADWRLPQFGGLRALKLMQNCNLDIPFIIVSGSIGEEAAIDALRSGASDYVLKDHPARLGQAVKHALEEKQLRHEREQAVVALNEAEEKHRALVEQIPVAAYTDSTKEAGYPRYISPRIKEILGFTPEEWLAEDFLWLDYVSPEDRERIRAEAIRSRDTGEPLNLEFKAFTKDGQTKWIHDQAVAIRDETGKPLFWQGVLSDITERKAAEEAVRSAKAFLDTVVDMSPFAMWISDKEGTAIRVNRSLCEILNLPDSDILGNYNVFGDKNLETQGVMPKVRAVFKKHAPARFSIPWKADDSGGTSLKGSRDMYIDVAMFPILDSQGELTNVVCQWVDITERKKAEEALRQSEEKYRELIDGMNETVWVIDFNGGLIAVNKTAAETLGYSEEELLTIGLAGIDASLSKGDIQALAKAMPEDKVQIFETAHTAKDGRIIPVEICSSIVTYQGQRAILSIARDITERKKAEETLRLRMEQLVAINQVSQVVATSLDLDRVLTEVMSLAGKVAGSEYTSIVLVDEAGHISRGVENMPGVLSIEQRARKRGFTNWILRTRQPALANEIGEDGVIRPRIGEGAPRTANPDLVSKGIKSFVGLPLMVEDHTVGVLYLHSLRPGVFGDQMPLLTTFANQAAVAIEKARLYDAAERELAERKLAEEKLAQQAEELHRRNEELARLYRASGSLISGVALSFQELAQKVIEVVQQEFGQANCSLLVVQKDSNELVDLVASGSYIDQVKYQNLAVDGPGLIPLAIRTNKVINVGDVRSAPDYVQGWEAARSELVIPLKVGNDVIGAIDVQSLEPDAFSPDDERLMTVFAERAALALEHGRLNAQTEARLQQLTALRTVDMAISGSFDINLTLGILLDQVTGQLGVHAADILSFNATTQMFKFAGERGFRTQLLHHTQLRFGVGYAWRAIRERRVIIVADIRSEPDGLQRTPDLSDEQFVSYVGIPLIAKGQIKGVLEVFHREPLALEKEWFGFLEMLAGQAAIAIDNAELFDRLQNSNADLTMAYDSTLEGWASALELRDKETEGHTRRVTEMTIQLARSMGIKESDMVHIYRGALLHDIGKVGVPDSIVLKPGPLTDDEWVIMRRHPQYAYDMLSPIAYLRAALDIPYCHHEKWDGTGYPRGLKGEQIPLAARVFAVVDVWDALTSDRPYRKAWTEAKARQYIQEQSASHFDPEIVQAFLKGAFEKH